MSNILALARVTDPVVNLEMVPTVLKSVIVKGIVTQEIDLVQTHG